VDLWNLFGPFLKAVTYEMCDSAVLYVEAVARSLERTKPKQIIVVGDRRIPERAALFLARPLGIKTCFYLNNTILSREMTNKYELSDTVLVVGNNIQHGLRQRGDVSGEIVVVGDPRFDSIFTKDRDVLRREFCAKYNLDSEKPIVVMASKYISTNFTLQEKETLYRLTKTAFENLPGYQWIVKAHPNENKELLREQIAQWGAAPQAILQNVDIVQLFGIADAALMVTSMAGLEAMILKVPVVAFQPDEKDLDKSNIIPYIGSGTAWRARNAEEISRGLKTLVEDAAVREEQVSNAFAFASHYIRPPDGKSADRILSLLGVAENVAGSAK
jgi:CDP-glycerol glycerophosphotransferase (TagB/SpsB family)